MMLEAMKRWWRSNVQVDEVSGAADWRPLRYATMEGVWVCVRCGALILSQYRQSHLDAFHNDNVVNGPWTA